MLKIKDKTIVKSKVKKEVVKPEMVKPEDVKVKVKSPDNSDFRKELLDQVKEMRGIFESALTELNEVKVTVKALKERFV